MERPFQLDIDAEKVFFNNEWLNTQQLSEKIRRMIDQQDFNIGSAGMALEYLQTSLRRIKNYTVRLLEDDAQALEQHSSQAGLTPSAFMRQALLAYLSALPPLQAPAVPNAAATVITTEPVGPGEAGQALELKTRKSEGSAKVLVDPSLIQSAGTLESEWFKKNR